VLNVPEALLDAVRKHGEASYPEECCGFMLGAARDVVKLLPAGNERWDSAGNRYLISPESYMNAEREALREGLEILGVYHSHPDAPAAPSEFDRLHALPGLSYVIVSVRRGEARNVASWTLSDDHERFEPEPIATRGVGHVRHG
jgi:proteasome lid subunit RPN8/RPN11